MIYLSKPNGTHGVFHSQRSYGAFDIVKLRPGTTYVEVYPPGDFVGERDFILEAKGWADVCDETGKGTVPAPASVVAILDAYLSPKGIERWWQGYVRMDPHAQEGHARDRARAWVARFP